MWPLVYHVIHLLHGHARLPLPVVAARTYLMRCQAPTAHHVLDRQHDLEETHRGRTRNAEALNTSVTPCACDHHVVEHHSRRHSPPTTASRRCAPASGTPGPKRPARSVVCGVSVTWDHKERVRQQLQTDQASSCTVQCTAVALASVSTALTMASWRCGSWRTNQRAAL